MFMPVYPFAYFPFPPCFCTNTFMFRLKADCEDSQLMVLFLLYALSYTIIYMDNKGT